MKIAFNPSTVAALTSPPDNKDITFDLRGQNIFARGVKFYGTDTWRPVVDNLTSNSATSSLSANQGRILAGLINGKSDSDHNHDGRYIRKSGDTMLGALNFANGTWNLVGDDSYMGDCNVGGHFGIKAANTTYPGIAFFNKTGNHLGNLTAYSGNIKYGAYSLQFLDNGNTSVSVSTWTNPFSAYNSNAVADGQAICVWGQASQLSNLSTDTGDMSLWLKRVNAKAATLNMVLDGEYYANGNQRLAHVSEIPTSLKNPHSLILKANGTTLAIYDGSSAKEANFTYANVGAASASHTHSYYAVNENYGGFKKAERLPTSGFYQSKESESGGNAPWKSWMHLINCQHSNTNNNYALQIAASFYDNNTFKIRVTNGSVNNAWRDIIHSGNISSQSVASASKLQTARNIWGQSFDGTADVDNTLRIRHTTGNYCEGIRIQTSDGAWSTIILGATANSGTNTNAWSIHRKSDNNFAISRNSSDGANGLVMTPTGMGLGTTAPTQRLDVAGNIRTTGNLYISHATNSNMTHDTSNPRIVFSKSGSQAVGLVYTDYDSYRASKGLKVMDVDNSDPGNVWFEVQGYNYSSGYVKNGSNDNYVLLGGGGHKAESSLRVASASNADTVDGWHKDEINRTLYITSGISGLSSYWAKLWEINLNNQCNDVTITFLAAASYYPSYFSIFSVYLRQNGTGTSKSISARLVELIGNIAVGDTELRLYVNNTTGNCQLWGNVKSQYGTMNLSVLKKAWRTENDSSNIGTFFSTNFSSVQSLPGDGWNKIGVTQQVLTGTFNPSSHTHTWTSITDKIVAGNEFNIVNAGFKGDLWFNYLPINDKSKSATISAYCFGNGNKGYTAVRASGFIKNGGNEDQLLRADGGVAAFNWSGQSGQPAWLWGGNDFNSYYVYNPSNFNVNTAQYLRSLGNQNCQTGRTQAYGDVYTYNTYNGNTGSPTTYTSVIGFGRGTGGTVEIAGGWCNTNLYWRSLRDCCEDWYSWRTVLDSNNYTDFIGSYYWANVKISTSSSTTTSPTVSNLTATNSIKMGNILLEYADEINNITNNGSLNLNCRNSGNVSLCAGGGNVGIGTMSPTYKLDVNGQMRTSGFHHSSVNSDNYILLAGGGYKSFGGDDSNPIFLGYLNLDHGNDGTISSSFSCLGYSVPFTYTRGGNYCRIYIPNTTHQVFYIKAATASVNYSGGGMDTWTGVHRGSGAWWLHCYAEGTNEVRVKGFCQNNSNNDSWWGGNPLLSGNDGVNRITVCIFGYVKFR